MPRQILCTVGTSLLTNRDGRPWAGWNPRSADPLPSADIVDRWLKEAEPAIASAEINTLHKLEVYETDTLVLLHSDTREGFFCAERLKRFYQSSVCETILEKIGKLGYGADHFTSGLKDLVDKAIKRVHKGQEAGMQTIFCATGGFKAEIAFLNLMGALLGIEVIYVHELHKELVRLPRLPLTWDADFVAKHEDFFSWIDSEPRKSTEVESWLKGRPELRSLVEDGDDGCTYLSAAGDLLYKAAKEKLSMGPQAPWPSADPRPAKEKWGLSEVEHHRPKGWEGLVERLCAIDCVTWVQYDPRASGGPRVKVMDAAKGVIGICYGDQGNLLPLRVETTARGEAQTERVVGYLKRIIK